MVVLLARNWWTLALRGVLAILFGLGAFLWPGLTLGALVVLYGAYALTDGIFAIAAALVGRPRGMPWWSLLLEGLAGIAIGVLTFAWPGITALVLLYLIAAGAVVTGAFEIAAAVRLRKEIHGEWVLALGGILSVLFGLALILRPGVGAMAVVWLVGTYAMAFGVLLLALSLKLRHWSRTAAAVAAGI